MKTRSGLRPIFLLICSTLLNSCSFNSVFLHPDKYPADLKKFIFETPDYTLVVFFNGQNHQPLFTNHNGRDTVDLGYNIESVIFRNSNDEVLNGWFITPRNKPADITLLHLHGNAGSLLSQYKSIVNLVNHGFQIFMFDYSGFGFSEGNATRNNALIDAFSAMDYLKARPETINKSFVIYGQSFGGHLAAVVAGQREKEIDALVIEGAFSSAKDIAASRVPFFGRIFVSEGYSAKSSIKNYHKPLLIIHSTEDRVVPFELGKKLFDAANQPKDFFEIRNCHICGPMYYTDEVVSKIKKMLEKQSLEQPKPSNE